MSTQNTVSHNEHLFQSIRIENLIESLKNNISYYQKYQHESILECFISMIDYLDDERDRLIELLSEFQIETLINNTNNITSEVNTDNPTKES